MEKLKNGNWKVNNEEMKVLIEYAIKGIENNSKAKKEDIEIIKNAYYEMYYKPV